MAGHVLFYVTTEDVFYLLLLETAFYDELVVAVDTVGGNRVY